MPLQTYLGAWGGIGKYSRVGDDTVVLVTFWVFRVAWIIDLYEMLLFDVIFAYRSNILAIRTDVQAQDLRVVVAQSPRNHVAIHVPYRYEWIIAASDEVPIQRVHSHWIASSIMIFKLSQWLRAESLPINNTNGTWRVYYQEGVSFCRAIPTEIIDFTLEFDLLEQLKHAYIVEAQLIVEIREYQQSTCRVILEIQVFFFGFLCAN